MSQRVLIVVSGLPASGKSTVARTFASAFGFAMYDKDDFLESLFEQRGIGDAAWRRALSRDSDRRLIEAANGPGNTVLSSFWRHPGSDASSGTDSDWLLVCSARVIEVYCDCPSKVAVERFVGRRRHPGHLDDSRPVSDLLSQFREYTARGALGVGELWRIDTETDTSMRAGVAEIVACRGAQW